MTIQSMTGFARSQGTATCGDGRAFDWVWEFRSVNGKGLDVRLRLASGFEHLEPQCKAMFSKHFARGNIQALLTVESQSKAITPQINDDILEPLLVKAKELQQKVENSTLSIDGLLAIKGVLEFRDSTLSDEDRVLVDEAVLAGQIEALQTLVKVRTSEGTAVASVLKSQVEQIDTLTQSVKLDPSRTAEAIAQRLRAQVRELLAQGASVDEDRLYQEAAILATKSDLQEEIDRLEAHVIAANELLNGEGPVGRKLDFLAQEFNRECNTVCSKSNATAVTKYGLAMKVVIDQLREQTQNLE